MFRSSSSPASTNSPHAPESARPCLTLSPSLSGSCGRPGATLSDPARGDHEIWFSPKSMRHFPVDSKIKSRHTANGVLKQAGLGKHF
jgi:hypothetical protein